jgi:hypothetical protein
MTRIEIYALADGKVTDWWAEINLSELFNTPRVVTLETGESPGDPYRPSTTSFAQPPPWRQTVVAAERPCSLN